MTHETANAHPELSGSRVGAPHAAGQSPTDERLPGLLPALWVLLALSILIRSAVSYVGVAGGGS